MFYCFFRKCNWQVSPRHGRSPPNSYFRWVERNPILTECLEDFLQTSNVSGELPDPHPIIERSTAVKSVGLEIGVKRTPTLEIAVVLGLRRNPFNSLLLMLFND